VRFGHKLTIFLSSDESVDIIRACDSSMNQLACNNNQSNSNVCIVLHELSNNTVTHL